MKSKVLVLLMVCSLTLSCSSDKNEDMQDANTIVGTWEAAELKIDEETASDQAKFGKAILDHLSGKDCVVLSFTFNEDLTVVAKDAVNYLEIDVNSILTGFDIPCPTEEDIDSGMYTYDGSVLTYVDGDGITTRIDVLVDGNTMSVDAAQLDVPNFNASGEVIFKRK